VHDRSRRPKVPLSPPPPADPSPLWLHLAGAAVRIEGAADLVQAVPDLSPYRVDAPAAEAWPVVRLRFDVRAGWINPDLVPPTPAVRPAPSEHPEPPPRPGAPEAAAGARVGNAAADLPDSAPSPWPARRGAPGALGWARHDLRFEVCGTEAEAVVDGSAAAFEAALQLALQVALLPWGVLWVHGAAGVDTEGRAWLVPGASGAGKSTLAREAGWPRALADEMVATRLRNDGGFEVFGTPFWSHGRTRPLDTGSAPLAVLALPVKAPEVAVDPLDEAEAAAHLLSQVALYEQTASARAQAFDLACLLAAQARCVALSFVREGPWLHRAEAAFGRLGHRATVGVEP
jgi:hypothetical protein